MLHLKGKRKAKEDEMAYGPHGVYRTKGVDGLPNTALVESGTLGFEIHEQEYRDQGYKPDFDDLPCGSTSCANEKIDSMSKDPKVEKHNAGR